MLLHHVEMNPASLRYVRRGTPNHNAVFYNMPACPYILKGNLMSGRNIRCALIDSSPWSPVSPASCPALIPARQWHIIPKVNSETP